MDTLTSLTYGEDLDSKVYLLDILADHARISFRVYNPMEIWLRCQLSEIVGYLLYFSVEKSLSKVHRPNGGGQTLRELPY